MANLVYKRVSTDQQLTGRHNLVLDEVVIEDPIFFEEEADTSSRLHPLQRTKFGELLAYSRPGDTVHISQMFRLVRGTQHILDVLDVLHTGRLALRIHDGAFSAMDLAARHPRTAELLSTVKFIGGRPRHAGQGRRLPTRGRTGRRRARRARPRRDCTARSGLHVACQRRALGAPGTTRPLPVSRRRSALMTAETAAQNAPQG
ncbi:recombinase family protein [Streptomyces sp. NPDC048196]|uniref:recombinase family protein n=1 Tax=Streptomyces sp. NPDC048196 TaxID=3154712 RepID=UPI00340D9B22